MQVILDSSFARPGSAPVWGGKKGEFRDWTSTTIALRKPTAYDFRVIPGTNECVHIHNVKPWPNRCASRLDFTCDSVWPGLACTCVGLHSLWSRSNFVQVDASSLQFGHPTQAITGCMTSICCYSNLLINVMQDMQPWNGFCCDLCGHVRKLASPFGHPMQISMVFQLTGTCDYLGVCLARA